MQYFEVEISKIMMLLPMIEIVVTKYGPATEQT
jgi:hypothetical protein